MYTTYFGLKEKPFSIAPDPQYLFMSDRHREALEHLTYGLGDAGGFVLLTGEVGTGKTTVSRRLIERLPENTQSAFILNPTLSSQELLATLCDELKIRYRKTGATLKTLTDKIQEKLLKNHKEGINTLLIIDEAQHLQPEVLEQLRLLTNLETNTKKLLQVILIGQPELQTLLKRRDLRQLAQRITARYHLLPLNKQEVAQYIKHRLSIAEGIRALFSESAMHTIHKLCGGIPRLINLVCDRCLSNACSSNSAVVSKRIVLVSAEEALGDDYQVKFWWESRWVKIVALMLILSVFSAIVFFAGTKQYLYSEGDSATSDVSMNDKYRATNNVEKNTSKADSVEAQSFQISLESIENVSEEHLPNEVAVSASQNIASKVSVTQKKAVLSVEPTVKNSQVTSDKLKVNKQHIPNKAITLTPVEGVSDALLNQFKKALNDEDTEKEYSDELTVNRDKIDPIENMPLWVQKGIPTLQVEQHIYASDGQGWIKVNGRDRYEGDTISRELILVEIRPQKIVLNFRGEKFTMRALSSWE